MMTAAFSRQAPTSRFNLKKRKKERDIRKEIQSRANSLLSGLSSLLSGRQTKAPVRCFYFKENKNIEPRDPPFSSEKVD
jgi:hypothetical protein